MKLTATLGSAALVLSQVAVASTGHRHAHQHYGRRNQHEHQHRHAEELIESPVVEKRQGCTLPDHPDLYHVPGAQNGGYAMSPDQPCGNNQYCPLACRSGMVMAQWEKNSTYADSSRMNGGLLCVNGTPQKPFGDDSPYCVDGTGTVVAVNTCGKPVTFCQTVLPGNEAMLIPTVVYTTAVLAVPGPDYWQGTSSHFYINPPGYGTESCIWGSPSNPIGNWAPYVAGANTDPSGLTYVKIAWNPEYIGSGLTAALPTYGVRIECPDGSCNGLPCTIDPSKYGLNAVASPVSTTGVGDANFCVVTVPKGKVANIVIFNTDGSTGSVSTSIASTSTTTTSTTSTTTTSKTTSSTTTTTTTTTSSTTTSVSTNSTTTYVTSAAPETTKESHIGVQPGIFHENGTVTSATLTTGSSYTLGSAPSASTTAPASTTSSKNDAANPEARGGAAIAGLIVAFVAAAALY